MLLVLGGHHSDICNGRKREELEGCVCKILCMSLDVCGKVRGGRPARAEGKRIGCEVCEECGLVSTGSEKTIYS